jgi:hypothetical protein
MIDLSDGLSYEPGSGMYELDGLRVTPYDDCNVCGTLIYVPSAMLPDGDPVETERVAQEYMTFHESLCGS